MTAFNRRGLLMAGGALAATGFCAGAARATPPPATAVVHTSNGPVQGLVLGDVHTFKGVRYGAPPLGAARFKPPRRPTAWSATETALGYGAPAIQSAGPEVIHPTSDIALQFADIFATASDMKIENEDCLYLNVWTKGTGDKARRPVMVWIHGGGFAYGSGGWPMYDGANLARRGDVVVITVNHRLNVFGYLDLSHIGGPEYAQSGNAGMLDLVLMLEWVRDNAAAFGGDPGNVTIMGESGGGYKVSILCAMPAARGLFHKAIIQSGPCIEVNTPEQSRRAAEAVLTALDVKPDNLAALQSLSPAAIVAGAAAAMGAPGGLHLRPVLEPGSIPRHPFAPDAPAISADVPIMVGWNKDEMSLFMAGAPWFGRLTEAELPAQMQKIAGAKAEPLLTAMRAAHPDYSPTFLLNGAMSAQFMFADSVRLAERKAAQHAAPVYMYNLVWDAPVLGGYLKCPHGLDVPLMFDNLAPAEALVGAGPVQDALAAQMANTWIAFARTGDPNHAGLPTWPAYEPTRRATMMFGAPSRVEDDPISGVRRVLTA
jgi:para-nitrobenzyl esterase